MIDEATKLVLNEISADTNSNTLVKTVGTSNYFASVINTGSGYVAHCTDGVGSKAKLLCMHEMCDTIGRDCFAMNYNDILCVGGNALSFQNHITATNKHLHMIPAVIRGMTESCNETFTSLTGGETEILRSTGFHVSGSLIGNVANLIDGMFVQDGDVIIGLDSSGIHANGWTSISEKCPEFITPENLVATKLYHRDILPLSTRISPNAIINVTGGGWRNLERIPKNYKYELGNDIDGVWKDLVKHFSHKEFYTQFNCGVGMMVIINPKDIEVALETMVSNPRVNGRVTASDRPQVIVNGQDISGDTESYNLPQHACAEQRELNFSLTDN